MSDYITLVKPPGCYALKRPLVIDETLSERERYIRLAAFVDGEGCIQIYRNKQKEGVAYTLRVLVTSTTTSVVQWCCDNFGGSVVTKAKSKEQNRKKAWDWSVSAARAEAVLVCIHPFLLIKQEQALLALDFRKVQGFHMRKLNRSEKEALWYPYHIQMKQLNSA